MASYTLAVDYGTSNTVAILRWPDGRTRPLLFDGSPLLPSAVYAMHAGHFATGRDAFNSARLDPTRFEPNPKRRIDDLELFLGDSSHPLPMIISATLARVAQEARQVVGGPVDELTMTYPVEWGGARRAVLLEAAATAGLPTPRLVPEPVAAGTSFTSVLGHRVPVGGSVVVYDLGAGTFDVSVIRRTDDGFETLAYRGLDDLGGVDLDELVLEVIGAVAKSVAPQQWQQLLAPATATDRRAARLLRDDARMVKERLSRDTSAALVVPLIDREVHVTREEFEVLARPLIARTVAVTVSTLRASRVQPGQLAGLFLVGGSTRMPLVATELHRATGIVPTVLDQPEMVVAEGALSIGLLREEVSGMSSPPAPPPVGAPVFEPAGPFTAPPPATPYLTSSVTSWPEPAYPVSGVPDSEMPVSGAPVSPAPAVPSPVSASPAPSPVSGAAPSRSAPSALDNRVSVQFTTTVGNIVLRALVRLIVGVPAFALLGLGLGQSIYDGSESDDVALTFAVLVWLYGTVWLITSLGRIALAASTPRRLLIDATGLTVESSTGTRHLKWTETTGVTVGLRGINLRPTLLAVVDPHTAREWLPRPTATGGPQVKLAVADLRTLHAPTDKVLEAIERFQHAPAGSGRAV